MTIQEFLDWIDGCGIIFTDKDLVAEELRDYGILLTDMITISKPNGEILLGGAQFQKWLDNQDESC